MIISGFSRMCGKIAGNITKPLHLCFLCILIGLQKATLNVLYIVYAKITKLATVFFDRGEGLTYSKFKSLEPKKQEELMVTLMKIKFAMALVYGFDRADKAFIDWKEGHHDT